MTNMTNKLQLKLNKDRQLLAIKSEHFSLTCNGYSNAQIKDVLGVLGISADFVDEPSEQTKSKQSDAC